MLTLIKNESGNGSDCDSESVFIFNFMDVKGLGKKSTFTYK